MILCVDTKVLKTDPQTVQKDANIEEILKEHTKYFPSVEDAYKENYVPIDFSISVRSMYDNTVLQIDGDNKKLYYQNVTNVPVLVHSGYDLVMFMSSIGLMMCVDYKFGFDELMAKHSQYSCIGLFNPSPALINPIIYSHIIMSDEGMKLLESYLKQGVKIVPITEMQTQGNLNPMIETLIVVKEGKSNAE